MISPDRTPEYAFASSTGWRVYLPAETFMSLPGAVPDWLSEIRALRARAINRCLAAAGNPPFHRSDIDALDHHSYHVVALFDGKAIGCIRLSVDLPEESMHDFFGGMGFTGMDRWSPEIWTAAIASRWFAATEHRTLALAQQLVGGVYALGGYLGVPAVYAAVGTRMGQDKILMRSGAVSAKHFGGLVPVPRFNDFVYIMKVDLERPRAGFAGVIDGMRNRLAIEFALMDARTALRSETNFERVAA